jgi:uncharacterized protein (DUF1778 family)
MAVRRKGLFELIKSALPSHTHTQQVEVRLTAVEEQLFKLAAEHARTTVSEWLRAAGRAVARVQLARKRRPKGKAGRRSRRRTRR